MTRDVDDSPSATQLDRNQSVRSQDLGDHFPSHLYLSNRDGISQACALNHKYRHGCQCCPRWEPERSDYGGVAKPERFHALGLVRREWRGRRARWRGRQRGQCGTDRLRGESMQLREEPASVASCRPRGTASTRVASHFWNE